MRKLMMLAAMVVAVALLAASPALAQDEPAVVADAKAKTATAGGAKAEAECKDGVIEAKAGGVVAKAPCEPEPPKAAPAAEGCSCPGSCPGSGSAGPASEDRWYQCCLAVRAGRGCSAGWRWPLGA